MGYLLKYGKYVYPHVRYDRRLCHIAISIAFLVLCPFFSVHALPVIICSPATWCTAYTAVRDNCMLISMHPCDHRLHVCIRDAKSNIRHVQTFYYYVICIISHMHHPISGSHQPYQSTDQTTACLSCNSYFIFHCLYLSWCCEENVSQEFFHLLILLQPAMG